MWTEPSLIFALTVKFQVEYSGRHWSDSDALFACMKRALDNGIPILDGKFLAQVTRLELERIFSANIELPMLDEKMESWHQVGSVLAEKYNGRFHNFVKSCPLRLYDNGAGLRDRLVKEFPRFNDISQHDGATAKFYNLPQLGIWFVYWALRKSSQFGLEDVSRKLYGSANTRNIFCCRPGAGPRRIHRFSLWSRCAVAWSQRRKIRFGQGQATAR